MTQETTQQTGAIAERLETVRERLEAVCARTGSTAELVVVSKTFPAQAVNEAVEAGQRVFGENYAQEGCGKVDWFAQNRPDVKLTWHFIGPLQANKTRGVAERFDWVDSVDRLRIAKRLNDQRPEAMPHLKLRGLMAVPEPETEDEKIRRPLKAMKALFEQYKAEFGWDTLSMGMSADMVQAVEEGATMVRVGSAIFGPRHYPAKA